MLSKEELGIHSLGYWSKFLAFINSKCVAVTTIVLKRAKVGLNVVN
jgi:hypothetical protein